ncbi:MAG: helix-turn-helix domain-containing protein [Ginsengibacter sp.]
MNEGEFLKKMGAKIKVIRNEKQLSLRELGKLCNLDYGSICRIEKGQMNSYLLTLKNIADKLEVDVKDFL